MPHEAQWLGVKTFEQALHSEQMYPNESAVPLRRLGPVRRRS